MQTILGANGIIGEELAKELKKNWDTEIKLVGRNPMKVNDDDLLEKADLLQANEVKKVLKNTEIAYLTVGLPYNSEIWSKNWIVIMDNVINACIENNTKLVYFDNTYGYSQDAKIQTENTKLNATGIKGIAKIKTAELLLDSMANKKIEAVICRAPEFYGPGKTKSITNALIFESLKQGKKTKLLIKDDKVRTLIYTPDASKAMALIGNTPETFGETWHLPCDDNRLTYKEIISVASKQLGRELPYVKLNRLMIHIISLFNSNLKETKELLSRYEIDNIFDSSKFKQKFPEFAITTYEQGIKAIIKDYKLK